MFRVVSSSNGVCGCGVDSAVDCCCTYFRPSNITEPTRCMMSINDVNWQSEDKLKIDFIEKSYKNRTEIMKRYMQPTTTTYGRNKFSIREIFRFDERLPTAAAATSTTEYRRWLYIENNKFFCLYCLLFPDIRTDSKRKRQGQAQDGILLDYFVKGMDYTDLRIRVCQNINRHEDSVHHKLRNIYVQRLLPTQPPSAGSNATVGVPVIAQPVPLPPAERTGTSSNNYDDDAATVTLTTTTSTSTTTTPTATEQKTYNGNGNTLRNAFDCIIKIITHVATHGMC